VGYVDLSTLHTPIGGTRPPAAYGRQIEANFDFLAAPPSVRVRRNADQTGIVTATDTVVLFTDEDHDTDTMHSTVTDTGRLTAPTAGKYRISGAVAFDVNATGSRILKLRKNGTTVYDADEKPASASFFPYTRIATTVALAAGDYVELVVYQTSGGNTDLKFINGVPHFEMEWVSL